MYDDTLDKEEYDDIVKLLLDALSKDMAIRAVYTYPDHLVMKGNDTNIRLLLVDDTVYTLHISIQKLYSI